MYFLITGHWNGPRANRIFVPIFHHKKNSKKMKTLKQKVNHLNQLILQGKALEGFELYYDDSVVMQENESQPTVGKEANRLREQEFFMNVSEFRGARVLDVAVGENSSYVKWFFDYTHNEWGRRRYTQVSVQQWENGKIVKEQFFYGN
jgi:hypothetical protein